MTRSRSTRLVAGLIAAAILTGVGPLLAVEPRVAGINQLVVIPPGTHERGLPAVRTEPLGQGCVGIDVPPTLHVHRYYYSGDHEFQGPILQGGPTVVVANHPKTGDRLYVNLTLPAGSPLIAHSSSAITYIYPNSRVAIAFSSRAPHAVIVKYHSGRGTWRRTREIAHSALTNTRGRLGGSPTLQSLRESAAGGKDMLLGAKEALDGITADVIDHAKQLGASLPGMAQLKSSADDRFQRSSEALRRGFQAQKDRAELQFVPTNR